MKTILKLFLEIAEVMLDLMCLLALLTPVLAGCIFGALASLATR